MPGSLDQSASAAAPQPVSELYRAVVDTQGRRARSRGRGRTLAVSLAVALTAAAGWLSRDRLPELASGLVNNQPGAAEVVPDATAALMSRSPAEAEPRMPLAGQLTAPAAEPRSAAPVSSPDDDPGVVPIAVSGPQTVASAARQPGSCPHRPVRPAG